MLRYSFMSLLAFCFAFSAYANEQIELPKWLETERPIIFRAPFEVNEGSPLIAKLRVVQFTNLGGHGFGYLPGIKAQASPNLRLIESDKTSATFLLEIRRGRSKNGYRLRFFEDGNVVLTDLDAIKSYPNEFGPAKLQVTYSNRRRQKSSRKFFGFYQITPLLKLNLIDGGQIEVPLIRLVSRSESNRNPPVIMGYFNEAGVWVDRLAIGIWEKNSQGSLQMDFTRTLANFYLRVGHNGQLTINGLQTVNVIKPIKVRRVEKLVPDNETSGSACSDALEEP